ncbi:histamine N-methyltransferase-like isoform X2 [Patiria miniata]|nr:histamine N-methyltransferase-like isoform X2 [Patiria miniata]XP_038068250.1 histamine N-methyltransferase-like isoform X2 [Patiria miniata]XP_038068252.1 histamine N-methyltransferase-like isoform X2 [Patiria miniata]XP_038068253.1 histamine N-methyltransferase-like isoform X2 [Patiria miniata]XP_038068254.1 histamine N-methyltransferase-like isoform X2 [Patiria miniata]
MDTNWSLLNNPGHYVKTFNVFRDRCSDVSVFSVWVDGVFSEVVVGKLQATLDRQEELRILGVGSGSGVTDCIMLERLLKQFSRINNRVVEPLAEFLDLYKSLVSSKAHQLHGVECDWRQQTIGQYQKAGDSSKFHFISAVHSIYYIAGDVDSGLMDLYNRLEPGGVMLVILNSDTCKFSRLLGQLKSSLDTSSYNMTSADIRSCLDRRGIPYTQYPQTVRIDVTQCFDQASEEGGLLLDFVTHVVNFRKTAPEDMQRSVMECLGRGDCSERESGGAIFLNMDWDIIVINQPQSE